MGYSTDPKSYSEKELFDVASMYLIERKSQDEIRTALNIASRAKVAAMIEAARKTDIVQIAIRPLAQSDAPRLRDLASQVRERFNLLDCVVVNGRPTMLEKALPHNLREVTVDNIARETAKQVARRFAEMNEPRLSITYGFVMRKVVDYLGLCAGINPRGIVFAAHGTRSTEFDRFDANDIVRDAARHFGCHYACMAMPAVVPDDEKAIAVFKQMPLVGELLTKLQQETNIVLSSVAGMHQVYVHKTESSVRYDVLSQEQINEITANGGIGNIGSWWFDNKGEPVKVKDCTLFGLGLDRLKQLVKQRRPVIIAAGADATRIPALAVALSGEPVANVWIGDEYTALALLGKYDLTNYDFEGAEPRGAWTEAEIEILDTLSKAG